MGLRKPRKTKPAGKFILIAVIAAILFGGYYYANKTGLLGDLQEKQKVAETEKIRKEKGFKDEGNVKPVFKIGVVTWGGYAGGEYFNKGFAANENSRYFTDYGFKVEFVVLDDFAASREAWKADSVDLLWVTADAYPTETLALGAFDPKFIFQADWSRGGDAIVATQNINKVNDLLGKKIAVAFGTPSHTFLLAALDAAGVSLMEVEIVEVSSAIDAAAAFKARQVDAAVVWSPDDADCVKNVPGAKVLTSTREAKYVIADGFLVKKATLDKYENQIIQIVEGWLIGASEINEKPVAKKEAAKILAAGLKQPYEFCLKAIDNVRLTTLGDNVNFFGLDSNYKGVTGKQLYNKMKKIYKKIRLAKNNTPDWAKVYDDRIIRKLQSSNKLRGVAHASEKRKSFKKLTKKELKTAEKTASISSKSIRISFNTGSSELSENAKEILRIKIGDTLRTFADMRVRLTGHTDSTGSKEVNKAISKKRAEAVSKFLAEEYGYDVARFVVIGAGPDKPIADNKTEQGRAKNRRTEIELIKS